MEHLFNIHVIVIADNGMKAVLVGHRTKPNSVKLDASLSPNWNN